MYKFCVSFICLLGISSLSAQQPITFPCDLSLYVGKSVTITNPLYVISNYNLNFKNQLTLSSQRQRGGTEAEYPGSDAYFLFMVDQAADQLVLASPSGFTYQDADNTCRTGQVVTQLTGTIVKSGTEYQLRPAARPLFAGNERAAAPQLQGDYNVKVVSTNLDYYMADPSVWAGSNGAKTQAQFNKQRSKIGVALLSMDADIYAICEIGEGSVALQDLTALLNELSGTTRYQYVNDGDTKSTTYTKNAFIYNSQTIKPYGTFVTNAVSGLSTLTKRHAAMGFELQQNGERFIINVNHFKAKGSGTGENADQGDGQGASNAARVKEAEATVTFINKLQSQFNDKDVLIVGDLNAYTMEDPIQVLQNSGLSNNLQRYASQSYSYSYQGSVGYLDHSLSTPSLASQVTDAQAWHVNADEPAYLDYTNNACNVNEPYRYSDHDPILTAIALGGTSSLGETVFTRPLQVQGDSRQGYLTLVGEGIHRVEVYDLTGQLRFSKLNPVVGDYFVLPVDGLKGCLLIRAIGAAHTAQAKVMIP